MKISVVGIGYVGLSNAVLLARRHTVVALDIDPDRVAAVNRRHCPVADPELERCLAEETLDLAATTDAACALDFVSRLDFAEASSPPPPITIRRPTSSTPPASRPSPNRRRR